MAFVSGVRSPTEQRETLLCGSDSTEVHLGWSGHKSRCIYHRAVHLQQFHFTLLFISRKDNVVADLLSHSVLTDPICYHVSMEEDLIQCLHYPFQDTASLPELNEESAKDPLFTAIHDYIVNGWPAQVLVNPTICQGQI